MDPLVELTHHLQAVVGMLNMSTYQNTIPMFYDLVVKKLDALHEMRELRKAISLPFESVSLDACRLPTTPGPCMCYLRSWVC